MFGPINHFRYIALCAACAIISACGEEAPEGSEANSTNSTSSGADVTQDDTSTATGTTTADAVSQPDTTDTNSPPEACAPRPTPLRRLSHFEYANTVRDLFPNATLPDLSLPPDNRPHEFDNDADGTIPSPALVERYMELGRQIAEVLGPDLPSMSGCVPADNSPEEMSRCGQMFFDQLGTRIFRRPLTSEERQSFGSLFTAEIEGATYQDRLQLTLQALLASPEFLYRFEQPAAAAAPGESAQLEAFSLANRLSYFLWATMPDDALLAVAQDGSFLNREVFLAHAERLVNDDRALHNFTHFHEQWLDVKRIDRTTKATEDNLDDTLRASMREQATQFIEHVLFRDNGSISDLLASDRTFIDASLAPLYETAPPTEGDWAETSIEGRRGILTMPFFLASHAHPDKPSPVLRGAFVLDRMMCVSLGAPPPNAEAQANAVAETIEGPLTNRAFYELVTSESPCNSCHVQINPIGAAFEHFDTMGRFQENDPSGLPIDAAASFKDLSFNGAADLAEKLTQDPAIDACMVKKWVRFAYAGGPLERSTCFTEELQTAYHDRGGSIRDLQFAIVAHPFFSTFSVPEDSAP